jgi:hypothetical protein
MTPSGGVGDNTLKSTDGGDSWSALGFKANARDFDRPKTFAGYVFSLDGEPFATTPSMYRFDGTHAATVVNQSGGASTRILDFAVKDGAIWALQTADAGRQAIWRSTDGATWAVIGYWESGEVGTVARSVEVHNGTVWVGTENSHIYEAAHNQTVPAIWISADGSQWIDRDGEFWTNA